MIDVDLLRNPSVERHRSHDLTIVVPGIMGSRLVDETGSPVWGLRRALGGVPWRRRSALQVLEVKDEERDGSGKRLRPAGLIGFPFWIPVLGGFEPYGDLLRQLRHTSVDPAAVVAFAYDWRLSIEVNAGLLGAYMRRELERWRQHRAQIGAAQRHPEERPAQIVLVAHSMGGLVAQALSTVPGGFGDVRAVVTLGTPFQGSVRAMELLAHGGGGPRSLSRLALREASRTMPGVYDLLPGYPCLFMNDRLEYLTGAQVASVGADGSLAADALEIRSRLSDTVLPSHRLLVGSAQPTPQTMLLDAGKVVPQFHTYRRQEDGLAADAIGRPLPVDHRGDGTVYLHAAQLSGVKAHAIAQQHGALATTRAVIDSVQEVTREIQLGAVLGGLDLGLDVPLSAEPASIVPVTVHVESDPDLVEVVVERVTASARDTYRRGRWAGDDQVAFEVSFPAPGLYRVSASNGSDPVRTLVLVEALDHDGED